MSKIEIHTAAGLWARGLDTLAIAQRLQRHESYVIRSIEQVKHVARLMRMGVA